jgi:hypothetical protein
MDSVRVRDNPAHAGTNPLFKHAIVRPAGEDTQPELLNHASGAVPAIADAIRRGIGETLGKAPRLPGELRAAPRPSLTIQKVECCSPSRSASQQHPFRSF